MNWDLFAAYLIITLVLVDHARADRHAGHRDGREPGRARGAGHGCRYDVSAMHSSSPRSHSVCPGSCRTPPSCSRCLRWAGAAYLIWLGIKAWRHAGAATAPISKRGVNFSRGLTVALTNPKTIAFFTAFLPQFVNPKLPVATQLIVMCAVSVLLAALTDSSWAIVSGLGRAWFIKPARAKLLGRISGIVLIGGGVWLSLARRPG